MGNLTNIFCPHLNFLTRFPIRPTYHVATIMYLDVGLGVLSLFLWLHFFVAFTFFFHGDRFLHNRVIPDSKYISIDWCRPSSQSYLNWTRHTAKHHLSSRLWLKQINKTQVELIAWYFNLYPLSFLRLLMNMFVFFFFQFLYEHTYHVLANARF